MVVLGWVAIATDRNPESLGFRNLGWKESFLKKYSRCRLEEP